MTKIQSACQKLGLFIKSNAKTLAVSFTLAVLTPIVISFMGLFSTGLAQASCSSTPNSANGTDTLSVSVPSTGTYYLWLQMLAPSTTSNTVFFQLDPTSSSPTCYLEGGNSLPANTWTWVNKDNTGTSVALSNLSSGTHQVVLTGSPGGVGVGVGRILLLSDPPATCTPTALGDNCTTSTVSPTVNITAPANNATLSGTVSVSANASESGGTISKVQFKLDGNNLGNAITTSPYSYSWNTTTTTNAIHSLTALATDTAGNSTTSSPVSVTVNNAAVCTANSSTPPTTPTSLIKTSSTYTTIGLSWSPSTPSPGCSLSGYHVYRNGSLITTVSGTSFGDSGLQSGTSYSYSIQAYDSGANTSGLSPSTSFSTTPDNLAPTVPAGVTTSGVTAGSATLNWSASTDLPNPGGSGVKNYNIYRMTGTSSSFSLVGTSTTTSYTDSTLSPSTQYSYEITAVDNALNESAPSTVVSITTLAPTCSGNPTVPTGLATTAQNLTSLSFNWNASTASPGCTIAGYHIYRGGTHLSDVTTGTSFTDNGLTPNTSYSYSLAAFDTSGHSSAQTSNLVISTIADTTAPTAPGNVLASATSSQVSLTWTASTDNVGVVNYRVYRNSVAIATLSSSTLSYNDTTVSSNTDYIYQVSALDGANNESAKTFATPNPIHTPSSVDTTPPTAPTNVTVPIIAAQSANLSWTASTDNVGVAGYHIYINNVYLGDSSTNSFTLSCIAPSVSYTITIKAFDAAGNVSPGTNASFTSLSGISGDINCDSIVNSTDLFTMLRNWNSVYALPTDGDVNGDGKVNSTDLFDLLRNWGL